MQKIYKYKDTLLDELYLDDTGSIRRSKDGYLGRFKKGDLARFYPNADGYMVMQVPKQRATIQRAHLMMLLHNRTIPDGYHVDHIDGDRTNDSIDNLRAVTKRVNHCNRKLRSDNTSGHTGIRWSASHKHYVIRRTVHGKRLHKSSKTLEGALQILAELTRQDAAYTVRHGK